MIAEVALGRKTGRGVVGTFQSLDKRFTFMGWLTMLVPILTLPYYSVTGGWVMHYGMLFLTGQGAKTAETGFFSLFLPILYGRYSGCVFFCCYLVHHCYVRCKRELREPAKSFFLY